MAKKTDRIEKCVRCGSNLNNATRGWRSTDSWLGGRFIPYCIDCQQFFYSRLSRKVGRAIALFYACIVFDVPYDPSVMDGLRDVTDGIWRAYLRMLRGASKHKKENGESLGFLDGETDIVMAVSDPNLRILNSFPVEMLGREDWNDTERWSVWWGPEYSPEDCKRLDHLFDIFAMDIGQGVELSPRTEEAVIHVAKMTFKRDQLLNNVTKDNIQTAKSLQGMINDTLKNEALQRDDRPLDDLDLGRLSVALERHGLMEDGKILPLEKLQEQLLRFVQGQGPRYKYTIDVADQCLLLIANTTRENDGLPKIGRLQDNQKTIDYWGEFEPQESKREEEIRRGLGLARMRRSRKPKEDEGEEDADSPTVKEE